MLQFSVYNYHINITKWISADKLLTRNIYIMQFMSCSLLINIHNLLIFIFIFNSPLSTSSIPPSFIFIFSAFFLPPPIPIFFLLSPSHSASPYSHPPSQLPPPTLSFYILLLFFLPLLPPNHCHIYSLPAIIHHLSFISFRFFFFYFLFFMHLFYFWTSNILPEN